MSVVYLVSDESGNYKIGYTSNIKERLSILQTSNPGKIVIVGVNTNSDQNLELELHQIFKDKLCQNGYEWFRLEGEDIKYLFDVRGFVKYTDEVQGMIESIGREEPRRKRNKVNARLKGKGSLHQGKMVNPCHCRRCQEDKSSRLFLKTTRPGLDTNGFMTICKMCLTDLFEGFIEAGESIEAALLNICQIADMAYCQSVVQEIKSRIEKGDFAGSKRMNLLGKYKALMTMEVINNGGEVYYFG